MPTQPVPTPEKDNATRVLRRFRIVFNAVRTHFRAMEKVSGLGGAQIWALSLIQQQPGQGVGFIANSMDIHQSTASNLVKTLVSKQLLRTEQASHDKRAVQLYVTPLGVEKLKAVAGPFEGVLPDALRQLDPAILSRLDTDLGSLIALLGADEKAANIPLAEM
ncbi:MarR family transcriptional regulator [Curvibacter sp. CHRR-16]|uniref:MarR family winged helix-turn-helix transcriptional regulator n=1 Tax=Curvibacter sp. CHRR-16 TaxID=2835872 RepID=UPI001BD9E5F7|nr:MarR family transcriptional regulator [Curvibacter sp. CHRR-16]MBT0570780.1 MarR family transcriptional regulator [Curvibacter sp. CHRR-16]